MLDETKVGCNEYSPQPIRIDNNGKERQAQDNSENSEVPTDIKDASDYPTANMPASNIVGEHDGIAEFPRTTSFCNVITEEKKQQKYKHGTEDIGGADQEQD